MAYAQMALHTHKSLIISALLPAAAAEKQVSAGELST